MLFEKSDFHLLFQAESMQVLQVGLTLQPHVSPSHL